MLKNSLLLSDGDDKHKNNIHHDGIDIIGLITPHSDDSDSEDDESLEERKEVKYNSHYPPSYGWREETKR